jgi:hypothetical protein
MAGLCVLEQLGRVAHKGGGGSGGGGGSSGKVSWPSYLQDRHKGWLGEVEEGDVTMREAMHAAYGHSPYADLAPFDPTSEMAAVQAKLDALHGKVGALDAASDYQTAQTAAIARANELAGPETIAPLVAAFEQEQRRELLRSMARLSAGYFDANAVSGSAYLFALAALESDHLHEVAKFSAEMQRQAWRDRLVAITAATSEMLKSIFAKVELERAAAAMETEVARMRIVAMKEYFDDDAEFAIKDALWDLELFAYAGNLLGNVQGGATVPGAGTRKGNSGLSMLGGALSGAASGALAGSMVAPGIGTVIGAVAGGGLALAGGTL